MTIDEWIDTLEPEQPLGEQVNMLAGYVVQLTEIVSLVPVLATRVGDLEAEVQALKYGEGDEVG